MKTTLQLLMGVILSTAGCVLGTANDGPTEPALIGRWKCVSATVDGKELPGETVAALRLELTKDRYRTVKGKEVLFDSAYRIETASSPKKIFMVGTEGEATGKEASGIYKFQQDQLWICYTMPGDPPPTAFESGAGSKRYLVVWTRE